MSNLQSRTRNDMKRCTSTPYVLGNEEEILPSLGDHDFSLADGLQLICFRVFHLARVQNKSSIDQEGRITAILTLISVTELAGK